MNFWKTLIPDEPVILDQGVEDVRYFHRVPPAVKAWCLVSLVGNGVIAAIASAIFQHAGPLVAGMLFALFPSYILLFWKDLVSSTNETKQKAFERVPLAVQVNLSVQWAAVFVCVAMPLMLSGFCIGLWFTYMR